MVDSGIDYNHASLNKEFDNKLVKGHNFYNGADNDQPIDDNGHGTHVAGIVSAAINNNLGMLGFASYIPSIKLMPVKVTGGEKASGSSSEIASGIIWAVDNGAKVINISNGSKTESLDKKNAVDYALNKGVVVIASMGNNGDNNGTTNDGAEGDDNSKWDSTDISVTRYPAAQQGVIAVGNIDPLEHKAYNSNFGDWISICAPGSFIYSTYLSGKGSIDAYGAKINLDYNIMSGTSQAAPMVSALAAVMLSVNPNLTNTQIKEIIEQTATHLNWTPAGVAAGTIPEKPNFNTYYGYGKIDALAAINAVLSMMPAPVITNSPSPSTVTSSPEPNASPSPALTPSPEQSSSPNPTPSPLQPSATPVPTPFVFSNTNNPPVIKEITMEVIDKDKIKTIKASELKTANFRSTKSVQTGNIIKLKAVTTDKENDKLTYKWSLLIYSAKQDAFVTSKEQFMVKGETAILAPVSSGKYFINLVVSDGKSSVRSGKFLYVSAK